MRWEGTVSLSVSKFVEHAIAINVATLLLHWCPQKCDARSVATSYIKQCLTRRTRPALLQCASQVAHRATWHVYVCNRPQGPPSA
jgi:hypothetical protein